MDKMKFRAINTGAKVYITDCTENSGYYFQYHSSKIPNLFFDGEKAIPAFKPNWYVLNGLPRKVQIKVTGRAINQRYEINDKDMISKSLPAVIEYGDGNYVDDDGCFIYDRLYTYKSDKEPDHMEDVEIEWDFILNVDDFEEPPKIEYKGIHRISYNDETYIINNSSVKHQLLDQIIYPEILLHSHPCKFDSKTVYDITRQYVIEHIDNNVARITSNYDFCFEVRKLIKKHVPEKIYYHNLFAKTKKQREKLNTSVKEYNEYFLFGMTYSPENYKGYAPIPEMVANNEAELKEKMDNWLHYLIGEINRPLVECPYCNGIGFVDISKEAVKPNYSDAKMDLEE